MTKRAFIYLTTAAIGTALMLAGCDGTNKKEEEPTTESVVAEQEMPTLKVETETLLLCVF